MSLSYSEPLADLTLQIARGLERKSAQTCSRWSELYRIIQDPKTKELERLSHKFHPWTKEMRDTRKNWVSPKATQMGITEVGLDVALYSIDVLKRSVLYLLPKRNPDATDFSKDRFGGAIELSPHLTRLFNDVNNVGHKKAGPASLYIRGSRTKSSVKSLPVGTVIFDEYDEMKMSNVTQAEERLSGQFDKQWLKYSTPTAPNFGIDLAFKSTTQEIFSFRCPACRVWTNLDFPNDLVIYADSLTDIKGLRRSHYKCHECGAVLPHETKPEWLTTDPKQCLWVSQVNADAETRGFYINQFYSFTRSPVEIAEVAIKAQDDKAEEEEFYNSKGGKAHIPEGAGLTSPEVQALLGAHVRADLAPPGMIVTMGVDQGKRIYYQVNAWNLPDVPGADLNDNSTAIQVTHGFVHQWEELDKLMYRYQINGCVCDHDPERRNAEAFARRFFGFVHLCHFPRGVQGKLINQNKAELTVAVNRTSWLDQSLGRFHRRKITLPKDTTKEYISHICALIRRYSKDSDGNPIARYISIGADHYGLANCYTEIALPLAISIRTNRDVGGFL